MSDQKYNLAKAYYLVSYFQINKKNLSNQDDGEFIASDAAKIAGVYGINSDKKIDNPYYSFWVTNKNLLNLLDGDNDISNSVKIESMKRLAYILNENYADFYNMTKDKSEKVDAKEIEELYDTFSGALEKVTSTDDNKTVISDINEIKKSLNSLRPSIKALYNVELEEIK